MLLRLEFSNWWLARLCHIAHFSYLSKEYCTGWNFCKTASNMLGQAKTFIIRNVQKVVFYTQSQQGIIFFNEAHS